MTKYFEVIGDEENVVIDDNFECLELVASFPLSQCTKVTVGNNVYYRYPKSVYGGVLYGITVGGLVGKAWFSFETDSMQIKFYDQNSNLSGVGMVSVARDDIIANSTLYVYGISDRKPSEHMVGLEIYNEQGKVVFCSDCEYINTIACGSDYTETILYSGNAIIFNLGYDRSCDYYESHKYGRNGYDYTMRPKFEITSNSISISKANYGTLWVENPDFNSDVDIEHYFEAWLGYGWLVASI